MCMLYNIFNIIYFTVIVVVVVVRVFSGISSVRVSLVLGQKDVPTYLHVVQNRNATEDDGSLV